MDLVAGQAKQRLINDMSWVDVGAGDGVAKRAGCIWLWKPRGARDRPAQRSKGGASRCPPPSVIWPRLVCSVRVRETNVEDQDSLPCFGSQAASSREGNGRQGWGWGGNILSSKEVCTCNNGNVSNV